MVRFSRRKRDLVQRDRPDWGNLRSLEPFSQQWGFDRGTPVDRYYIDAFIASCAADIRGEVLEVMEPLYANRFENGSKTVTILDVDPSNTTATLIADLGQAGSLPNETFDCFILTQTLQLVPDIALALENAWRTLAPGGVLLLSVPAASKIESGGGGSGDYWRLTPAGLDHLLRQACPSGERTVRGYGNLLVVLAFLMGLATEELDPAELDSRDELFPLVACARVRKPWSATSP